MTGHGETDNRHRDLVNPPCFAGRYRMLDRNSAPNRLLPVSLSEAPTNRPYDLHSKEGI